MDVENTEYAIRTSNQAQRTHLHLTFTELNRSLRFLTEALRHGGVVNLVLMHLRVSVAL